MEAAIELTPSLILGMWAGGIGAGAAAVARWRIVGPGFLWLAAGVGVMLGGLHVLAGGGLGAVAGTGLMVVAGLLGRRPAAASAAFVLALGTFLALAIGEGGWLPALTGTALLGGITCEMLLGHWYLVDPRLPRWALQRLDVLAATGLVLDVAVLAALGAFDWDGQGIVGWAFVALAVMTGLLLVGVWFSLREPSYSGVMAATGLSYLAVLTGAAAVIAGRSLVESASLVLAAAGRLPAL